MPLRLAAVLALPLLFSCATAQPPAFRLRRVVLYQNGIGHFERTGRLSGSSLALVLGAHEIDDALKTLTVVEHGATGGAVGGTGVMAIAPQRTRGQGATVSVRFGHRPRGDVSVAYAVPTPTWRAAYRVVLPDGRGAHDGWLQAWALVHNVSTEDWRDVRLTLASSGPLSYAVDLQSPEFVPRPDATGHLVQPVATGAVASERTHGSSDHDGIPDEDDVCSADAEDRDGFEDDDGCPEPDNDQDRILDEEDRCPNDPESYNGESDEDGCPDQGRVLIEESQIIILDKVYFASGSAEIRGPSIPILDAIAATLLGNPQIRSVEVQGHASAGERDAWGLSAARARAVRQALLDRRVQENRLVAVPYGDAQPVDPRPSQAARERNRRVEFLILATDQNATQSAGHRVATEESSALTAENIARGARTSATPTEMPGGTQYHVSEAVTIPAGASTLVTILNRRLAAEDVLLFRPGEEVPGSDRHPLRAARIVNDTALDLVAGPVALFGRGAFVGEGILDGLGAGENAFVPYALDRSTNVAVEVEHDEQPAGLVALTRGVLTVESSGVSTTRYVVEAGGRPPARIFVRHVRRPGHELGEVPPGTETTSGALLVPIPLTAGRTSVVTIEERRPVRRDIALLSDRTTDLGPYLGARHLDPEQAEALRAVIAQRLELGRLESEATDLRERLADAGARSAQLRETLTTLHRSAGAAAALRRQVLERLHEATSSSEDLATRLAASTLAASEARARLEQSLADLVFTNLAPR